MKNILSACILLMAVVTTTSLSAQKTWVGKGSGGSGTDFNTPANWSPVGVPTASDNVTIAGTTTATITLSANASIKNLTFSLNGNSKTLIIDADNNTLIINGTATIDAPSGNSSTNIGIGVYGGSSAGIVDFKGNVTVGSSSNNCLAYLLGNSNSKLIFRGNLTLGDDAVISSSPSLIPGTAEFDGSGTQTIRWDNTQHYAHLNNVVIGNTNNPTVLQTSGAYTPDNFLGNLTVNGSSTLDLGTSFWNRNSLGGTFAMNGSSVLKLGYNTYGQTGSNFPVNFSSITLNSASTIEYNSTLAQTIYAIPSPGYTNLTLSNNSTKTAGGNLLVRGSLFLNSPATFAAGSGLFHSISGDWTNNGSFNAGTSTITFNGSLQQDIQGAATSFYNLVFNNTANNAGGDILLNNVNATVTNVCTFTDGIVNSVTSNMLIFNNGSSTIGANNNSFVNVKVRKTGNSAFTFPVGKINVGYMRCGISAPSLATDAFTAEYTRSSATSLGSITASGIVRVSGCEYWILDRTTGTSSVNVTLSWSGLSPCNAAAYVTLLSALSVVHFNGTSWNAAGSSSYTGTGASGSVTWNGVSSFSPFTLGSTSAISNPLPVRFSAVKASPTTNGNAIEWVNFTEENLRSYEVERSTNGISFNLIDSLSPKANDGQQQQYLVTDHQPTPGINYYRIKAVQTDGAAIYSAIVRVDPISTTERTTDVYPNPIVSNQFTVQLNNYQKGNYLLKLIGSNGQQLMLKPITHQGGSATVTVERSRSWSTGLYVLQIIGEGVNESRKLSLR